ncbi:MAG TPA: DUF1501 domain-containing protein [Acidimicrobiales bacterium]|nr:DUF1501 domain-containing protein [Acidimicrobiales bacterium]
MPTPLSRRRFLQGAASLGAAGALRGTLVPALDAPRHPTPGTATPQRIRAAGAAVEPTLVLVTLYGGNDGLNTVVPYQDPAYEAQRGAIAVKADTVLDIGNGLGLHPALTGMKSLWDAGKLAIIRGVGYPDPNYSHFASMDIWQAGSTANDVTTGWIGRWLDATGADPMRAISLGANVPSAFAGARQQASAIAPSSSPYSQLPPGDPAFRSVYKMLERPSHRPSQLELLVARSGTNMLQVSRVVADALRHVPAPAVLGTSAAGYLGQQLAVVAQLIEAGLPTRAFHVSLQGFDTHAGELVTQAQLLQQVDTSVAGFLEAIARSPRGQRAVVVLYTEFGRRVQANASGGTDHGAANDAFVLGHSVRGGLYGDEPSLTRLDVDGNLVVSTDFRSIYATCLEQILGVDAKPFLGRSWPPLGFL